MNSPIYTWTKKLVGELENDLRQKIISWEFLPAGKRVSFTMPNGKKISYQGIKFSGSPRLFFWAAFIEPFLTEGIIRVLSEVGVKARQAGASPDQCIRESANLLQLVIIRTYAQMAKTSSKLSGDGITKGPLQNVAPMTSHMSERLTEYRNIALLENSEADKKHVYLLKVASSLAACQRIELELKLYITQALELVEKCVGGKLAFKMKGIDYQNASLERLIETFRKLSTDPALVKRLVVFKDERNFVAHGAIAACIDPDGNLLKSTAAKLEHRLKAVETSADALSEAIQEEAAKFLPHLYFESLPPTSGQ